MKLVTYEAGRGPRAGILTAEGVVDAVHGGLGALLRVGGLEAAREVRGSAIPLGDVRLLPPVTDPQKIICLGLNYRTTPRKPGWSRPRRRRSSRSSPTPSRRPVGRWRSPPTARRSTTRPRWRSWSGAA